MNNNLIPTFNDITSWQKRNFVSTGGTRAKFISLNTEGDIYYFKGAKETKDGEIRYPLEFWSEIISSKIGQMLGFNMLDYNIGYDHNHIQKIGFLSKSMIDEKKERLTEGMTYLQGFSSEYNPEIDKKKYTFKFVKDALTHHEIDNLIPHLINTIIFDGIVGNSDRHQENWGFIRNYIELNIDKDIVEKLNLTNENFFIHKTKFYYRKITSFFRNKKNIKQEKIRVKINFSNNTTIYSPIYDSGCCLAREKTEEEIIKMNNNENSIVKYINKGKSEIHWEGEKVTHFKLIENLMIEYNQIIKERLKIIKANYQHEKLTDLVNNIDKNLPESYLKYKLTDERKQVIIKIVNLRIEKILCLI